MHDWHLQCNGVPHCQLSFLLSSPLSLFFLVGEGAYLWFWELLSLTGTSKRFHKMLSDFRGVSFTRVRPQVWLAHEVSSVVYSTSSSLEAYASRSELTMVEGFGIWSWACDSDRTLKISGWKEALTKPTVFGHFSNHVC